MDVSTTFALSITTLMAICGVVVSAIALVSFRRVIAHQTQKLSELATMKPYWIIEKREGRIESVIKLTERVEEIEQAQTKFVTIDPAAKALEEQFHGDAYTPPLAGDDQPDDLGTRE